MRTAQRYYTTRTIKALANKDTLFRTHCCRHKCFPFARARNICCRHKFCVREAKNVSDFVQKHFLSATNVSQFAQPKKHHDQQCVRNNVASFAGALTSLNMRHYANFRLSRTFAFYLCEPRLPIIFFHIIIAKKNTFAQYLFLFSIGHTKMRFEPVKLRNFHRFHRGLKGLFVDG